MALLAVGAQLHREQATLRFQIPPGGVEKVAEGVHFRDGVEIHVPAVDVKLEAQEVKVYGEVVLDLIPDRKHPQMKMQDKSVRSEYETLAMKLVDLRDEHHLRETLKDGPSFAELRTERVTDATAKELLAQTGVAVGEVITEDVARRIQKAAAALDEHIAVHFHNEKKGLVITIRAH